MESEAETAAVVEGDEPLDAVSGDGAGPDLAAPGADEPEPSDE
jgi:hypothetical protein